MNERELIQRCLDGDATPQELALVRTDPKLRRLFVEHQRIETALRAAMIPETEKRRLIAAIMSDTQGRDAADTLAGIRREIERGETVAPPPKLRILYWLAPLAAAAAVVIAILAPWHGKQPSSLPPSMLAKTGDVLAPRAGEIVTALLEDGSRITLQGPADLIVGRTLRLRTGRISVQAAKHQAGDPLIVLTPHGRSEVVGTHFSVDAGDVETKLAVSEGSVRFVPNGGGVETIGAGSSATGSVAARDPIHQPFASDSPWNTAIGNGAQYEPMPVIQLAKGAHIETTQWAVPIFVARAHDPVNSIFFSSSGEKAGSVRVDPTAHPSGRDDSFIALVDEHLGTAWELYGETRTANGDWFSADVGKTDLRGSGWNTAGTSHAGASILGGLLRKGELRFGIGHALAVQVLCTNVNQSGRPFEWPATRALTSWHRYGTNGNIRLGSLLAIPPDVNLAVMNLDGEILRIAKALQDYGAYVVGTFNGGQKEIVIVAERACAEDVNPGLIAQLDRIAPLLQRVANNDAQHVGGGGTPRRPAPPPLQVIETATQK